MTNQEISRRDFLKLSAVGGFAFFLSPFLNSEYIKIREPHCSSCIYRNPTEQGKNFLEEHLVTSGDPNLPYVAMTYDDQPFNENTEPVQSLLDTYKKNRAIATFFFRMQGLENNQPMQEMVKRAIDEGHEVGFHGWRNDHPNYLEISPNEVRGDLERCLNLMYKINPNYCPRFIRWPFGLTGRLLDLSAEYGLQVVNWNLESGGQDSETKNRVLRANNGSIVLSHMTRYYDVKQARDIIQGLRDKGLSLVTVSEILKPEDRIPETKEYFNIFVCPTPTPNKSKHIY